MNDLLIYKNTALNFRKLPIKSFYNINSRFSFDTECIYNKFQSGTITQINKYQSLKNKSRSNYSLSAYDLFKSSSDIFDQAKSLSNHKSFVIPNELSAVIQNLFNLELKIDRQWAHLTKIENELNDFVFFIDDYKVELDVTDEELWAEYGAELYAVYGKITEVARSKHYVVRSKKNLHRALILILSTDKKYGAIPIKPLTTRIAFSTKNLDDEHIFDLSRFKDRLVANTKIVFYEKTKNYISLESHPL